jgi:Fe-S cluster assembly protein SufD
MIEAHPQQDIYHAEFERLESAGGPAWFVPIRKAAIARFGEMGLPTTRDEEWHYTSVAALGETPFALNAPGTVVLDDIVEHLIDGTLCRLVFVNGQLDTALSEFSALPDGVTVQSIAEAIETEHPIAKAHLTRYADFRQDAFNALNTALFSDGLLLHVPKGTVVEAPIQLIFVSTSDEAAPMSFPRNLMVLEANSQATVAESYVSVGEGGHFTNTVTEVVLDDSAVLDHYKIEREDRAAHHVGNLQVHQARSSNLRSHTFNLGGGVVRNNLNAVLDGEGADAVMNGLTVLDGRQHVDNHLRVDHAKPHCTSWEYFKGVYDDQSRGVFSGRIYVHEDAQKTDAKQTNMSLILSDEALADSKPQLEIFADDVKCTHGATIGQIDEEAIFYLQARGLNKAAARSLLIYAFAGETIETVRIESLRKQVQQVLMSRLPQGHLVQEAL